MWELFYIVGSLIAGSVKDSRRRKRAAEICAQNPIVPFEVQEARRLQAAKASFAKSTFGLTVEEYDYFTKFVAHNNELEQALKAEMQARRGHIKNPLEANAWEKLVKYRKQDLMEAYNTISYEDFRGKTPEELEAMIEEAYRKAEVIQAERAEKEAEIRANLLQDEIYEGVETDDDRKYRFEILVLGTRRENDPYARGYKGRIF